MIVIFDFVIVTISKFVVFFKMADLKKVTLENQKLREEMLTLTWNNQASLAMSDEIYVR